MKARQAWGSLRTPWSCRACRSVVARSTSPVSPSPSSGGDGERSGISTRVVRANLRRSLSMSDPTFTHDDLIGALTESQRLGFLGARPIPEVIEHSHAFVDALVDVSGRIADIGAGGGVPGFVVIAARPDLHVSMIDRRTKRTDVLQRLVVRHGLSDRVSVLACEVDAVIADAPASFDAVIARGFGPPMLTLSIASQLAVPGGRIVISEPPDGDRWAPTALRSASVERLDGPRGVAVFVRV